MESQSLVILANILVLLIFVLMRQINKRVFQSILLLPLANQFKRINEYETLNKKLSYTLFYLLTFLSIILTIQFYDLKVYLPFQNKVPQPEQNFLQVSYLSLIIGLFFFFKTAVEYVSLCILDIKDKFKSYITYKFLLANYCIVLLIPLLFFIEYNDFNIMISFNEAIILLFLIYTTGQLVYILANDEISLANLHYIFLYLCVFEFGTYLVIYKFITG
mgnify:CR=1 FL=1